MRCFTPESLAMRSRCCIIARPIPRLKWKGETITPSIRSVVTSSMPHATSSPSIFAKYECSGNDFCRPMSDSGLVHASIWAGVSCPTHPPRIAARRNSYKAGTSRSVTRSNWSWDPTKTSSIEQPIVGALCLLLQEHTRLRALGAAMASAHIRLGVQSQIGRVEMWRGGCRFGLSVAASFVWRCPSTLP